MALRQGIAEIQKSIERSAASSSNSGGTSRWISWKDKDRKIIRFLLDAKEMYTVWVHEYVETPNGRRNFVCRSEFQAECPLCAMDVYKRELGYSLAVVREEVIEEIDGQKQITGFKDKSEEVDGKTIPMVGIVSQAPGNFWSYVSAIYQKFGSLLEYDVEITRKGAGTDTLYMMFPEPKVEIQDIDKKYEEYKIDLGSYLENIGSQEYYTKALGGEQNTSSSESEPRIGSMGNSSPLGDETEFDRLRRQLREG